MYLSTIKLNLICLLIIAFALGCTDNNKITVNTVQIPHKNIADTCGPLFSMAGNDIRDSKGNELESDIGCRSCHSPSVTRNFLNLPTMYELSRIDSLKLKDFIFITKHKGYFKTNPLLYFRIKKIDSLSECDRKNLIHYIKNYSRPVKHILLVPNDPVDSAPKK